MKLHAPYSFAAAVLVVTSVAVGLMNRPHASAMQTVRAVREPLLPAIALSAAGRGTTAPSSNPREGASTGSGVGTTPTLLERAQAGDARAQFRLSERIRRCRPTLALAERGVVSALTEAEECRAEGIPTEGDQAWRDKAIAAGDPIALLYAAREAEDEEAFAAAMDKAARSGDPEAHIALGQMLFSVEGADPVDAVAWLLVGCGDCMVDDPRLIGFANCVQFDTCQPGTTFADWLASSEGDGQTALAPVQEAQARAESLKVLYGIW